MNPMFIVLGVLALIALKNSKSAPLGALFPALRGVDTTSYGGGGRQTVDTLTGTAYGPIFGYTAPYDPAVTAESTIGSSGFAGGPANPLSTFAGAQQSIDKQYSTAFLDPGNAPMYPAPPSGTGPVQPGGYPVTLPPSYLDPDATYVDHFNWWDDYMNVPPLDAQPVIAVDTLTGIAS